MKLKKIMVTVLATTMLMSVSLTAFAADGSGGSGGSGECTLPTTTTTTTEKQETAVVVTVPVIDATKVLSEAAKIKVGGKEVQTTVAGVYLANKVAGIAITTPVKELSEKLNLKDGQKAYVVAYDFDQKKSYNAMKSLSMAAEVLGADFVEAINVNLGAMQNGKFIKLEDGSVQMAVGIPKTALDVNKTYSVIGVQSGGAITYYEDLDNDPQTVTFNVKAGLGAYAIVAK